MHYDTLIIGAGLSGLAAGIRCAYFDQRVCVLERHTTIGGLNSFYRLRGRNHDVGLHAVTNYAAPGTKTGPLSKLLRQLRIRWEDFALCEQVGSSVVFPGATLRFTNDFELLQQEIVETFPEEKDNFQRFHSHLLEFNELDLHQEVQSAREVVGRFLNNPLLIDMLFCPLMFYGSARPDDMDWNQFVIMYKSIFMEGFARPYKGVRPIMKTLVRKYREVGGELRLRAGVNRILVEDGRAVGVELDNGERLTADRIVSSAGSVETLKLCDDEAKASSEPRLLEPGDVTFNEIIDVINVQPADLGHDRTIIFFPIRNHSITAAPMPPAICRVELSVRRIITSMTSHFRRLYSPHRVGQPSLLVESGRGRLRSCQGGMDGKDSRDSTRLSSRLSRTHS